MKIAFFINDVANEKPNYSTTHLAMEVLRRGHELFYIGAADFACDPDEIVRARARVAPKERYRSREKLLADLAGKEARVERIDVAELDVLFLRSNPADESDRPWAQSIGIVFGELARRRGVIVLNDPEGLSKALNKLYFQTFPEELRPKTLITRDRAEIRAFAEKLDGNAVLKPLQGSGGTNVFLVRENDAANLNQMIDAILRDGYVVAQEYLPAAAEGDTRLVLMNGEPLAVDGKYAAYRRIGSGGDMRSNLTAGGELARAKIGERELAMAELVRPRLIQDGMFLVGLDIAGDKLMEVNVFSPGGIGGAQVLMEVNFAGAVIDALERKVDIRRRYHGHFDNRQLATL